MSGGANNRILDILFVLDATWSMDERDASGNSIMDRMNNLVEKMMREIVENSRSSEVTKIAFLTFADDITMETKFRDPVEFKEGDFVLDPLHCGKQEIVLEPQLMIDYQGTSYFVDVPRFSTVGVPTSSRIGKSVMYAVEKLMAERARLVKLHGEKNVKFYVPIMILITDGAPKNREGQNTMDPEEEKKAIELVNYHCHSNGDASNLIYPIICGIGDEQVEKHLKQYSKGYTEGFQHIDKVDQSKGFEELFKKIGLSITGSFDLNDLVEKRNNRANASAAAGGATKMGIETYRLNDKADDDDEDDEI